MGCDRCKQLEASLTKMCDAYARVCAASNPVYCEAQSLLQEKPASIPAADRPLLSACPQLLSVTWASPDRSLAVINKTTVLKRIAGSKSACEDLCCAYRSTVCVRLRCTSGAHWQIADFGHGEFVYSDDGNFAVSKAGTVFKACADAHGHSGCEDCAFSHGPETLCRSLHCGSNHWEHITL